jgi:hypothetical protein
MQNRQTATRYESKYGNKITKSSILEDLCVHGSGSISIETETEGAGT